MKPRKPSRRQSRRQSLEGFWSALAVVLACSLVLTAPWVLAAGAQRKKVPAQVSSAAGLPATDLTSDQAIVHALNRLGYGPRPGDIERVKQMGLDRWIDRQLHPEIIDDSAVAVRLARFPTLTMSSAQLEETYPRPAVAARREGITPQEYRKQQQEQLRAVVQTYGAGDDSQMAAQGGGSAQRNASPEGAGASVEPGAGQAMAQDAGQNMGLVTTRRDAKREGIPPDAMANLEQIRNPQRIVAELAMAKTDRAIYSERQLYEHMVDFWFNHFNVFAAKGADRWLLTSYERDAIRPYAMGKFRDLLEATAKSPAMLFYLDNWQSVDPEAWKQMREQPYVRRVGRFPVLLPANAAPSAGKKQDRGLNENYGRELMELHTLGVDGGYTQQDVIAVARAFTGWTIRQPQRNPQFEFDGRLHDNKPKVVLGHTIDAGGIKDGEQVLDLLARDPHTAHHLSLEIAQEFVSDNPPEALVERMSRTYLATDGDIRAVLHTMIYSPEFWSPQAYRAKVKTPFELVVSAARAMNADVQLPLAMVQWTGRIGEPLYQCQPPNGYSDEAKDWVNTGALINRLNYSLALAGDRLRGATVDAAALLGPVSADPASADSSDGREASASISTSTSISEDAALGRAIDVLLAGEVSPQTRQALSTQLENPKTMPAVLNEPAGVTDGQFSGAPNDGPVGRGAINSGPIGQRPIHLGVIGQGPIHAGLIAGLVLGAPEFQRR